jgi:hypothetical protein
MKLQRCALCRVKPMRTCAIARFFPNAKFDKHPQTNAYPRLSLAHVVWRRPFQEERPMRTQWPHARLTEAAERTAQVSLAQHRARTRYLPLERNDTLPAPSDMTITLSLTLPR